MIGSRNFSGPEEVSRRPGSLTSHAYFMMGYAQCLRDGISQKYGREIPFNVTSGDRTDYNDKVQGAAPDSYHIWRTQLYQGRQQIVTAIDLNSPAMSTQALYYEISTRVRGEVYWNQQQDIVHLAPFGVDERFMKDKNGKTINYVKGRLQ